MTRTVLILLYLGALLGYSIYQQPIDRFVSQAKRRAKDML